MDATGKFAELREEQLRRERELLRVYRPMPHQEEVHRSQSSEVIVIGGKRGGKSMCISAEFASRVTGRPIMCADGSIIESPWPKPTPEKPRVYWIIGWATDHIGQTIHRLLFQPAQGPGGNVHLVPVNGTWEIYNVNNPEHVKLEHLTRPCEPLIPERLIEPDSWEWENKKANHFNSVRLKNGATICAYPSSSRNPKQGDAVSGIWIDEDIQFPGHLQEWQDRLSSTRGWFLWSAWPHDSNHALLGLMQRADAASEDPEPIIQKFRLVMTDNQFISDKGKEEALARMGNADEQARRNRGELLTDQYIMYQFNPQQHQIQRPNNQPKTQFSYEPPESHQELVKTFMQGGRFPREWTRYLSIDPSNTRTGVHSWVVPPREWNGVFLGDVAIAEWELVAKRFAADMLAQVLKREDYMGGLNYEAFVMDMRAGRQTHAGRSEDTYTVYAQAMARLGLKSRLSGSAFIPGCDVPHKRHRVVREMLLPQPQSLLPKLMFVEERCLETKQEFERYRKKVEKRGEGGTSILDEPMNPRLYDLMASMEYAATYLTDMFAAGRAYVDPDEYPAKTRNPILERFRKSQSKKNPDGNVVYLGVSDTMSAT